MDMSDGFYCKEVLGGSGSTECFVSVRGHGKFGKRNQGEHLKILLDTRISEGREDPGVAS